MQLAAVLAQRVAKINRIFALPVQVSLIPAERLARRVN